jgi:tetratricopeptide (TPR) repeat protein
MQYQERLDDAKAACRRGLAAADASRTPPLRAILTAKLADIEKLQGEFWSSDNHYQSALQTLREWHPESAVQRRFAEHWDARIQREQGNLLLFMARPTEAVALLEQSLAYFQREHEIYEEARVSHSLGWAAHLMGDWDRSMAWRLRSIELADLLEAERGWRDPLLSLQGNLYLGLLLEDQGNYAEAEHYLIHALELTRGGQSNQFHEVGLVQIALSRIFRADWSQRDLAQSEWFAEQGLQFYESMLTKDPMRLAIAHNAYSDLLVEKRRFHEALLEAEQAIQWAQSSTPPNPYYEAAGHLRCARAILLDLRGRSSIDSAPLQLSLGSNRASASSSSVQQARRKLDEERVEAELEEAARLARSHNLRQTSVQTAAIQALLSLIRRDTAAVETCCWEAIWSALHVNRHILQQTWRSLEALPLTSQNRARLLKILYEKTNDALGEIRSLSNGSAMAETLLSLLRDAASQNSSGGGKK